VRSGHGKPSLTICVFFLDKCEDSRPALMYSRTASFLTFYNLLLTTRPAIQAIQSELLKASLNKQTTRLTFVGPCIVIYFYIKTNQMHNISNLFYFGTTLYEVHVSDGLSVHHQESKTVHTASGVCHTGSVAASSHKTYITYT